MYTLLVQKQTQLDKPNQASLCSNVTDLQGIQDKTVQPKRENRTADIDATVLEIQPETVLLRLAGLGQRPQDFAMHLKHAEILAKSPAL